MANAGGWVGEPGEDPEVTRGRQVVLTDYAKMELVLSDLAAHSDPKVQAAVAELLEEVHRGRAEVLGDAA